MNLNKMRKQNARSIPDRMVFYVDWFAEASEIQPEIGRFCNQMKIKHGTKVKDILVTRHDQLVGRAKFIMEVKL